MTINNEWLLLNSRIFVALFPTFISPTPQLESVEAGPLGWGVASLVPVKAFIGAAEQVAKL